MQLHTVISDDASVLHNDILTTGTSATAAMGIGADIVLREEVDFHDGGGPSGVRRRLAAPGCRFKRSGAMAAIIGVAGMVLMLMTAGWVIWDLWHRGTLKPHFESPSRPQNVEDPPHYLGKGWKAKARPCVVGATLYAIGFVTR